MFRIHFYSNQHTHLTANSLKPNKVWEPHIDCLYSAWKVQIVIRSTWGKHFTFLNESRMHTILQKPRTNTGSCVSNMKINIIFCILIGNEYHLHCQSTSPNCSNAVVTDAPNSQNIKTGANDQKAKSNGETNSKKIELSSDFEMRWNVKKIAIS